MTKDEKERKEEVAAFSRRKAIQWKIIQSKLQDVLNQMDDFCLVGAEFTELENLIHTADRNRAAYWADYYKNTK